MKQVPYWGCRNIMHHCINWVAMVTWCLGFVHPCISVWEKVLALYILLHKYMHTVYWFRLARFLLQLVQPSTNWVSLQCSSILQLIPQQGKSMESCASIHRASCLSLSTFCSQESGPYIHYTIHCPLIYISHYQVGLWKVLLIVLVFITSLFDTPILLDQDLSPVPFLVYQLAAFFAMYIYLTRSL